MDHAFRKLVKKSRSPIAYKEKHSEVSGPILTETHRDTDDLQKRKAKNVAVDAAEEKTKVLVWLARLEHGQIPKISDMHHHNHGESGCWVGLEERIISDMGILESGPSHPLFNLTHPF